MEAIKELLQIIFLNKYIPLKTIETLISKILLLCIFFFYLAFIILSIHLFSCQPTNQGEERNLHFGISFTEKTCKDPLDGRMLLMISTDESREPRFQINDGPDTQLIFGIDVNGLQPGEEAVIDEEAPSHSE